MAAPAPVGQLTIKFNTIKFNSLGLLVMEGTCCDFSLFPSSPTPTSDATSFHPHPKGSPCDQTHSMVSFVPMFYPALN